LPSVNTTSPYSSNNTSKSSSSSWLKSTSYNRTKFISLIPIVQFCSHLPLLSMGRLNMHTSHKGVWTPQLLTAFWFKLLKNFLSSSATLVARTKCDKTLKLWSWALALTLAPL
jgi:hypothetical protein